MSGSIRGVVDANGARSSGMVVDSDKLAQRWERGPRLPFWGVLWDNGRSDRAMESVAGDSSGNLDDAPFFD